MSDTSDAMYEEILPEEVGLKRQTQDMNEVIKIWQTTSSLPKCTWFCHI